MRPDVISGISQLRDILEILNNRASPLWFHPTSQSSSCCPPVWNSGFLWRSSCNLLKTSTVHTVCLQSIQKQTAYSVKQTRTISKYPNRLGWIKCWASLSLSLNPTNQEAYRGTTVWGHRLALSKCLFNGAMRCFHHCMSIRRAVMEKSLLACHLHKFANHRWPQGYTSESEKTHWKFTSSRPHAIRPQMTP